MVPFQQLLFGFGFKMEEPGFNAITNCGRKPHILNHMDAGSVVTAFLASLCAPVTMWQATSTNQGTVKVFNICPCATLTNEQDRI
jgi:hypothetical protein